MNRRALFVALTFTLTAAVLLGIYMRRFEREVSGGELVELLVTLKPIERGTVLTEELLTVRRVPVAYVEDRAVKAVERVKVLGIKTSVALYPQQTLLWTDLAITTEDRDLSTLVQAGKRAVTVTAAGLEDNPGTRLIRPGDYVDVVASLRPEQEGEAETSVVLLQRVLVLAVGDETEPSQPALGDATSGRRGRSISRQEDQALTLSLGLQEAQLLALAVRRGKLSVALRNPEDPGVQADVPDLKATALLDEQVRTRVGAPVRPAAPEGPLKIEKGMAVQ
ncbi:MAG TPA: Flp pilus assembly protein CpaB [Polyangiaceae bacterium]|nr:Flp pilus assembly protein CpaB [Polyangiaceae bacterium]